MSEKMRLRLTRHHLKSPSCFLAIGFGSGLAPKAPGTFGTLVAVPIFLLLSPLPLWAYLAVTTLIFLIGIPICGRCSARLGVHDHSGIVWDEIAGFLITMAAVPAEPAWIAAGFLLFRLFDILKPWPIRWLDRRVSGGFGIMVDDLLAGLFALIVIQLALWFAV